jgi:hypothetical protein
MRGACYYSRCAPTKILLADAVPKKDMSTSLARDVDDFGDKPVGVTDGDWKFFQARRRAERAQVDVDEGRLSPAERTQWTSKEFER